MRVRRACVTPQFKAKKWRCPKCPRTITGSYNLRQHAAKCDGSGRMIPPSMRPENANLGRRERTNMNHTPISEARDLKCPGCGRMFTGRGFSHHRNKSIECQSEASERIARSYQSRGLRRGKKIKVQTQGWNKINVYDYSQRDRWHKCNAEGCLMFVTASACERHA